MGSELAVPTPSWASFSVLLVMAGVCLILSLCFYTKSRSMNKFHKTQTATIYNKTFSVFNMLSETRRTHDSFLFFMFFSPMSALMYSFIIVFAVLLPLLYAGLVLWPVLAILCLSLMMIEEAIDARETANAYERAFEKHAPLAPGDLRVLSILKKVTPRLSTYYFLLALLFIASFIVAPYAFSTALLAWAYFADIIVGNVSATAIPFAIIPTLLFLVTAAVTLFVIGRKLKTKVFGFLPSSHLTSPVSGEVRRKLLYETMQETLESSDEITW